MIDENSTPSAKSVRSKGSGLSIFGLCGPNPQALRVGLFAGMMVGVASLFKR
jgi:hypothetical protein